MDLKNKIHDEEVLGMGLGGGIGGKNHTFLDGTAAYTQCTAAYAQCTAAYTYGTAAYMVNVRIKLPQSSWAGVGTELGNKWYILQPS